VAEISAHWVVCPKHACGTHGSCDYAHHQEAATKTLPYPFASAKHFYAKNAEGEALNKYANLQSKYAGNLAKKTLKQHMNAWDMISPLIIPNLVDPYALSIEDCWGEDRKKTGVNLLKNWGMLTYHSAIVGNVIPLTIHAPMTSLVWSGLSL
jgi:hypothetical protein